MEVGNTGTYYAFDVQRLRGGAFHTWAFHGCESESLDLNVPTTAQTVRWVDRTLEGTHRVGSSSDLLQATWTMTRSGKTIPYTFYGGGTVDTVGCEPSNRLNTVTPLMWLYLPVRMTARLGAQIELVQNATHPLVYGDQLLQYLTQVVSMYQSHVHPGQMAGPIPVTPAPPAPPLPTPTPSLLSMKVKTG
jgi:hypothetical protein